jgi:putative acetyltransferase
MIVRAQEENYADIIRVWELSVRATHHFLPEDYLQYIKGLLPSILPEIPVYVCLDTNGKVAGFLGVANQKIEMLFLHPGFRGKGLGRIFIQYAIEQLDADKVDVNEQNQEAVGFYKRMGFVTFNRSERDGLGKPFPLLHMQIQAPR